MSQPDTSRRILALAEVLHRWAARLMALDVVRRRKVARYADEIAETLGRAADASILLETDPGNRSANRTLVRELGRITGYLETIVAVLRHHLDGRKLAGVKRRLEMLRPVSPLPPAFLPETARSAADRLTAAEGYFRALADALRA
ncbi:MAG: hypothetical protein NW216_02145 [Hyphomicrobium sp.]|nr:hypothetical protein [Hyphomicrobium sp.]